MRQGQSTPKRGATHDGFSLIEALFAVAILSFGMLAVAQLLFATISGPALARSKPTASVVAADKLRFLSDQFHANPAGADLTLGAHGPDVVSIQNPNGAGELNRFTVNWTVANVPDPRAWKTLQARLLTVTVTPVRTDGSANRQASLNKVLNMSAVVSARP